LKRKAELRIKIWRQKAELKSESRSEWKIKLSAELRSEWKITTVTELRSKNGTKTNWNYKKQLKLKLTIVNKICGIRQWEAE